MTQDADRLDPPGLASGWLIVHRDGTIVAADRHACVLLRAPDPEALAGRTWISLVSYSDFALLPEARQALEGGARWHGRVRYRYSREEVTLDTSMTPIERSDDLAAITLEAVARPAPDLPARHPEASDTPTIDTPSSATGDFAPTATELAVQVAVHDALRDLPEPTAATRAALQAVRAAVPYEWASVFRFEADHVSVISTYPSPMAGIHTGSSWICTPAETLLREAGEPQLQGVLRGDDDSFSPLRRLPGFGLRSRILLPLYGEHDVVGGVAIYRAGEAAFAGVDGLIAERSLRRLGEALSPLASTLDAIPRAGGEPAPLPAPIVSPAAEPPVTAPEPAAAQLPLRLDSLSDLVAGVAHELNNPLTAILGYAQILGTLEEHERGHALKTIETEAQRAARIVRNLLAFARQRPGERRPVDVEIVLRRVIDLRRYALEMDNVRVLTRFGHVPPVRIDEAQFEQAFLNLLNNAQQALPGGGEVIISTWTQGQRLYISFADNGTGVAPELRAKVFQPFYTTRQVGSGEGMGLSIVYGVVTAHQGRTWVEDSPTGGAQFFIELPLDDPDATPVPAPTDVPVAQRPMPDHEPVHGAKILVVDDEAPVRTLMREILTAAHFEVATANDGAEALALLEQDDFAMVMTDLRMPEMSGGELYSEIQQRWPDLASRVLFVTGDIEGERNSRSLDVEATHYIEKPFTTQQLLDTIHGVLAQ